MSIPSLPSNALTSTDDQGEDGLIGMRHLVFRELRRWLLDNSELSRDFLVPSNMPHRTWGIECNGDVCHPTEIRVSILEPRSIEVRYGEMFDHKQATTWCRLKRSGQFWKGRLPMGARGSLCSVKLPNAFFPRVAARVRRDISKAKINALIAVNTTCGSEHRLYSASTASPSSVELVQSLDGTTAYSVGTWFNAQGKEYRKAYTLVSYMMADVHRDGCIAKQRALLEITPDNIFSYL